MFYFSCALSAWTYIMSLIDGNQPPKAGDRLTHGTFVFCQQWFKIESTSKTIKYLPHICLFWLSFTVMKTAVSS